MLERVLLINVREKGISFFESYNSRGLRGKNPNIVCVFSVLLIQAKTKQCTIILHNSKLYSNVSTFFAADGVHMNIIDKCYTSNKKLKHTCLTSRKKVTSCSSRHTIVSYDGTSN